MDQTTARTTLEFDSEFRGTVIRPGEPLYEEARAVYNGMIDKRPALVVRPTCTADVIDVVNLARDSGLPLAVRSGGHSVAGKSTCDGGILLDFSSLKGVWVDPERRTARANPGVLWGEFDRETQLYGLATPGGRVTTTGIGGFTLGGGYGWLSTKYGLTCDNLVSADVVTADGRLVRASETDNPDLLWGLRGGGGNFGVTTSFEFRLHPLGPIVLGGLLIRPIDNAPQVARAYRDYVETAPEELATSLSIALAPPAPFVPEHLVGRPALLMVAMYIGDPEEGQDVIAPLKELAPLAVDLVQPMPYTAVQALIDPLSPKGWQNYHRGEHLAALSDEAIDAFVEVGSQVESPMSMAVVFRHGGAISRVPEDATAAGHRSAPYMAHPIACWQDPAENERHIAWCQRFSAALAPFTTGGVYLNFEPEKGTGDVEARIRAGYGAEKYARLVALKDKWDPGNLFRVNHNIRPSRGPSLTEQPAAPVRV